MQLVSELEASLREFAAADAVEVRENGGHLAQLNLLSWEVRGAAEKPLLHLWSEQFNLTRRVLAITDQSDQRLCLAVERFGRARPDRLEFVRLDFQRNARDLSREEFCSRLKNILAQQFPDETLESLTASQDLEHSLSGNYARGVLKRGSSCVAVLAVPECESSDSTENCLTFALLWLERLRHSRRAEDIVALRIILPKDTGRGVAHRCAALHASARIELFELDPTLQTLEKMDVPRTGNVDSWLVPHRESQALLDRSKIALDPIVAMAPGAITLHPASQSREVLLRFRGMPFARWKDGNVFFGANDPSRELTPDSRSGLRNLLHDLDLHRNPLATDTRHLLYRAHAERWLESLLTGDVTRIDAMLDQRFVYSQVFANAGGGHGILDLLTITRTGRLAIIELKATEHIHLPLQAADYWLRIRRHLTQGDFQRYGYFCGIEIQAALPIVYLIAPALRFHPTTDTILGYFSPDLEVVRVGLAESWRSGLRVVMRQ